MDKEIPSTTIDSPPNPPVAPSRFDRATFLASSLKANAKKVFRQDDTTSPSDSDKEADLFRDAAFNPQQVLKASPHERGSLRDKLHRAAHTVADGAKNPRRALRHRYATKVAGNMSGKPEAYHRGYDKELIKAHDTLDQAKANADGGSDGEINWETDVSDEANPEIGEAKARIRKVQNQRDSLRIAWILGRHVRRVRVPQPTQRPPVRSDYLETTEHGPRIRWDRYLGHKALWHTRSFTSAHIDDFDERPFDLKDLTLAFERLAIVSAPWQNFLIDVRDVYLWKEPRRSVRYLLGYWALWYFQHIMTALFAWIIFSTVKNRLQPTKIETIRKRVQRAEDDQARAQAWGELIQRHGRHEWVEPFLDEVGPLLQLELSDLSNLIEMAQCFYRWELPRKTMATLFFFVSCLTVSIFADMAFCVKFIWFGLGMIFFFSLPIAARYPKYRRLVNPIYWILWDIPNMAELAITQLQEKAILRDATRLEKRRFLKSTNKLQEDLHSPDDAAEQQSESSSDYFDAEAIHKIRNQDQVTFRAVHGETRTHGRLTLQRSGLWYCDKTIRSHYPYTRLSEVRKVDFSPANNPDASYMARIARRIEESTSLQFLPSGIEFIFFPPENKANVETNHGSECPTVGDGDQQQQLRLTVSESDRDKIFNLVISWSNLRWRPMFFLNKQQKLNSDSGHLGKQAQGDHDLDKAIKSFVK